MEQHEYKLMTQDGIFKMLTWDSPLLTSMFGYPPIVDGPLQQESHEPTERKLDRFYRPADDSFLNVEHQSSLRDLDKLAERMIRYRVRIRTRHPRPIVVRQAIVFTGSGSGIGVRVPPTLDYVDETEGDLSGLRFTVPIRDLRGIPIAEFKRSGKIDDLLLGLMGPGRVDASYVQAVLDRIGGMERGPGFDAKVKLFVICASLEIDLGPAGSIANAWLEDVMQNPLMRQIAEYASRERIAAATAEAEARGEAKGEAKGFAKAIVKFAVANGVEVPEDFADMLTLYADEDQLSAMIGDMANMGEDIAGFAAGHGVIVPGYAS